MVIELTDFKSFRNFGRAYDCGCGCDCGCGFGCGLGCDCVRPVKSVGKFGWDAEVAGSVAVAGAGVGSVVIAKIQASAWSDRAGPDRTGAPWRQALRDHRGI